MKKIDVHGHYGVWNFPIPKAGTAENLLQLCGKYDIAYLACSSVLAICYDMQEGNEEIAKAFEGHPQLLCYVYCNPNYLKESVAEMERYLPLDNFVGVKIHASYSSTPNGDPRMAELIAEVARRASLVKMHGEGPDAIGWMGKYAAQYPHLKFIMAHAYGGESDRAARMARRYRNLYLEFCASWAGLGKIERALDICGVEQILFGSDVDLIDPAFVIGAYEDAHLTEEQLRTIYWDNAVRVLGLDL